MEADRGQRSEGVLKMTVEEEHRLALAAQRGDMMAKDKLFRHFAALVKYLAFRFTGPDKDELFAAGCEGWLRALRSWNPRKGSGFKAWVAWWVNAYAGRATRVHLYRRSHEFGLEVRSTDGELFEHDASDEGVGAEEMTDALWRSQAHGIIDGMKDRRLAIVLQQRMRGLTLGEIAKLDGRLLGKKSGNSSHEWVRQLEVKGLRKARALARAS